MLDTLLDPVRRAKAAEDQEKLRAVMGRRVNKDPIAAKFLFGQAREHMALDQLARSQTDVLLAQLADGLFLQGKFDGAVEMAPEGDRKEEYKLQAKAVAHVNEPQCEHPTDRQHTTEKIFNGKTTISFTKCLDCSAISAYA